jgi:hypothetical protein
MAEVNAPRVPQGRGEGSLGCGGVSDGKLPDRRRPLRLQRPRPRAETRSGRPCSRAGPVGTAVHGAIRPTSSPLAVPRIPTESPG